MMDEKRISETLTSDRANELLTVGIPARLAYNALDGTPRAIPIGFLWNGTHVVMCTPPNAAKVKSLSANPTVALTIDTSDFPPTILLIRGIASLELVDGIPDEYLTMNETLVDEAHRDEWEAEVRSLYKQMVRITVRPTWVKLIDFENTLPTAVEELMRERAARGES